MSLISRLTLRKTAKAARREQPATAHIHDRFLLLRRKRTLRQGDRKNLIGTNRSVVADARVVDHVIAAIRSSVPKSGEALLDPLGHFVERLRGFSEDRCKSGH